MTQVKMSVEVREKVERLLWIESTNLHIKPRVGKSKNNLFNTPT